MPIVAWSLINQTEQIWFEKSELEFKGYYKSIVKGTQKRLEKKMRN